MEFNTELFDKKGRLELGSILDNFPLSAAFMAIVLAQFVKVPIFLIAKRSWNFKLGFSTGGMPSSHSAGVCALTTAVGIDEGTSSAAFAIAVVVSVITMFDAAGIRRHAGIHASFINRIMAAAPITKEDGYDQKALKELLGHRPIEVFIGALFGIIVSFLLHWLY
jgi:acid phosphatase family membrane protein YuiD